MEETKVKSLEKKLKKELIDIILQKEQIERSMKADMKCMENILRNAECTTKESLSDYNALWNEYTKICDEHETEKAIFVRIIKRTRILTIMLALLSFALGAVIAFL